MNTARPAKSRSIRPAIDIREQQPAAWARRYVCSWHETVMPVLSPQVRYEGVNGPSSVAVRGPSLTRRRHTRPGALNRGSSPGKPALLSPTFAIPIAVYRVERCRVRINYRVLTMRDFPFSVLVYEDQRQPVQGGILLLSVGSRILARFQGNDR